MAFAGRATHFQPMKTMVLLAIFVATACPAQETNKITTKVVERDKDGDGTIDARVETTCRGKTEVMMETQLRNDRGVMTKTRSFYVAGEPVASESDNDGDGHFERLIIYKNGGKDLEAFRRRKDGSVKPVSNEVLVVLKRMDAMGGDFMKPIRLVADEKITPEQFEKAVMQLRAKSADLARQLREAEQRDKD